MYQQFRTIIMNDFAWNHTEHRTLGDNYFIPSPLQMILLSYKICFSQTSFYTFAHIIPPASNTILGLITLGSMVK